MYIYIYIYIYIYLCACVCVCKNVYMYLSHKLRCYTEISGPEKNRNNTREKISYFSTCVDNQLLTRHSPLAPPGQVDEGTVKPSRFLIQVVYRSFLKLWRLNTKRSVSLTDSAAQTFLEGEEKEKPKITYSVALVLAFLSAENENNWRIYHWPILAVYLKDFFCR